MNVVSQTSRSLQIFEWLLFLVILAGLVSQFFFPIKDGDYYWHLRSGQYLVEHRTLPEQDPFSFTTPTALTEPRDALRSEVLLSQYWLGQVFLYGLYQFAGETGTVVMRGVLFGLLLTGLYLAGRRSDRCLAALSVLLAGSLLSNFPTERPQIFTFLLMPLVLFLLELLRQKSPSRVVPLLLPLLMLLWANLHGGFLLGAGLCGLYLGGHLLQLACRRKTLNKTLVVAALAALCAAALNPNGYNALVIWLTADPGYIKSVYENLSPFYVWQFGHHFPVFWLSLGVLLVSLALGYRKLALEPLLSLLSLAILSMMSLRYMGFLPLAMAVLLPAAQPVSRRTAGFGLVVVLVVVLTVARPPRLPQGTDPYRFPVEAAEVLQQSGGDGRVFGLYEWGGYLGFRLPQSQMFIDGRGLVASVTREYEQVVAGQGWQSVLDRYGVDLIVLPGVDWYTGAPPAVIGALTVASAWQLAHWDDIALVFARTGTSVANRLPLLDKQDVYRHQVQRTAWLMGRGDIDRSRLLETRIVAQVKLNDLEEARGSCEALLKIDPDSRFAQQTLGFLKVRLGK